ncbi:class II aldolase/adducin family protein (plasmid) [Phyllobacteriaceae bacterium JZ32]
MEASEGIDPNGPPEMACFLELSARLGQNILRTQGAGGNTSIKHDGVMWVKASGTWLAHALERDIMVPVAVAPLVDALRDGDPGAEKATDFIVENLNASRLRPSIETSFHAVLTQPVVAHFHCVNSIALAVLERRETLIAERMARGAPGLSWRLIPYRRPGTPLAREIDKVAGEKPDVLVLCNHGIIVAGETVDDVAARIETATAALGLARRHVGPADLPWLENAAAATGYRVAADAETHATALCPIGMKIALSGSLYPDHVIFLGTSIGVLRDGQSIAELLDDFAGRHLPAPKMLIAPGRGVLVARELTPGGEAMARCLAEVVTRIPPDEAICYLDSAQEYELTHWEAEQYRQALDRRAAAQ